MSEINDQGSTPEEEARRDFEIAFQSFGTVNAEIFVACGGVDAGATFIENKVLMMHFKILLEMLMEKHGLDAATLEQRLTHQLLLETDALKSQLFQHRMKNAGLAPALIKRN